METAEQPVGELGDRLVLRRATLADIPALDRMHAAAYGHESASASDRDHSHDLLERPHPTFNGHDMTVVEDTRSGTILSAQHLSRHTWQYDGISFPVGEIERVATDPTYRRHGLVRAQMELMHGWSAQRGDLAVVINGIPLFYTQFGYELALEKRAGRDLVPTAVPQLAKDSTEPYRLRSAATSDLAFIAATYEWSRQRHLLSYVRTPEMWRYELQGRSPHNPWRRTVLVIEERAGVAVGYLSHTANPPYVAVDAYELQPGVPWLAVTPSVARGLLNLDAPIAISQGVKTRIEHVSFNWLGSAHPAFASSPGLFGPITWRGAWYIRIPDMLAFLRHIAPALQTRLAESDAAGYSGKLTIASYAGAGVTLTFERGRITAVEAAPATGREGVIATFAAGIFLQLLFGYRSLAELEDAFVYRIGVGDEARVLLRALFPKRPSHIWPVY